MNEQDKQAFEAAEKTMSCDKFSAGWQAALEYARSQTAQQPIGCAVNQISSRMCERGTPGCVVEHDAQPPADVVRELVDALEAVVEEYVAMQSGDNPIVDMVKAALKSAKEHGL